MASITKNIGKDGTVTYRMRCCLGRNELYKQVFATKTIPSPGLTPAAEKKAVETQATIWEAAEREKYKLAPKKAVKNKALTFSQFVYDHWLPTCVNDGRHSPDTQQFYKYMANALVTRFGNVPLTEISKELILQYLKYMRTTEEQKGGAHLSPATIKHRYSTLRTILNSAESLGYLKYEDNPIRKMHETEVPKRESKPVVFMNANEIKVFLEALKSTPENWQLLIKMLLLLGLRRGEAVGLQWRDIDFEKRTITICRNVTPAVKGSGETYHVGPTKSKKTGRFLLQRKCPKS